MMQPGQIVLVDVVPLSKLHWGLCDLAGSGGMWCADDIRTLVLDLLVFFFRVFGVLASVSGNLSVARSALESILGFSGTARPFRSNYWPLFDGLHEETCKDSDMEEWHARVDKDGKPTCLMGHTQSYRRRKKKAECFLKQEFKHAKIVTADCDCSDLDFECDYNFVRDDDDKKCVKKGLSA